MHGDIKRMVVKAESIWTPDILLINSKSDDFDAKFRADVMINYKGEASWFPPTLQASTCEGYFHFSQLILVLNYDSFQLREPFTWKIFRQSSAPILKD